MKILVCLVSIFKKDKEYELSSAYHSVYITLTSLISFLFHDGTGRSLEHEETRRQEYDAATHRHKTAWCCIVPVNQNGIDVFTITYCWLLPCNIPL